MADRIIRQADPSKVDRWQIPSVDESALSELKGAGTGSAHMLTAGQLDELQRKVQQEAQQRGFEQGLKDAKQEIAARVARLTKLFDALAYPFEVLDENVEAELATLAVALASQLVRREIRADQSLLIEMVRECLAVLPSGTRNVVLYLHPDDVALLEGGTASGEQRQWRLQADPKLDRGDIRVESDGSQIDGRLSARLEQIIVAKLAASESD